LKQFSQLVIISSSVYFEKEEMKQWGGTRFQSGVARLGLVIGTLGLLINEFIFDWGTTATLTFAALNAVGLAILAYTYWGLKKEA